MTEYVASLGFDAALALLTRCPGCGSQRLLAVSDQDLANVLCRACQRCWHVELGRVCRVDPRGCVDCPHRGPCLAAFAAERPSTGAPHPRS